MMVLQLIGQHQLQLQREVNTVCVGVLARQHMLLTTMAAPQFIIPSHCTLWLWTHAVYQKIFVSMLEKWSLLGQAPCGSIARASVDRLVGWMVLWV
jgi:hypothetical protein